MTAEISRLGRRVQTDVRHRDGAALGLPVAPNTSVELAAGPALWLGPDEWLVFGGEWSAAAGLAAEQEWRAVADAAVDVSAQRIGLRLAGPRAADLLAAGCALDLHPAVFRVGCCAQTLVARVPVDPHPTRCRGVPPAGPPFLRRLRRGVPARRPRRPRLTRACRSGAQ